MKYFLLEQTFGKAFSSLVDPMLFQLANFVARVEETILQSPTYITRTLVRKVLTLGKARRWSVRVTVPNITRIQTLCKSQIKFSPFLTVQLLRDKRDKRHAGHRSY